MTKPLSRRTQAGLSMLAADTERRKASRPPSKLGRHQRLLLKHLAGHGPTPTATLLRLVAPNYLGKVTDEKRLIRATVSRSLRQLAERGLAERTEAGWAATVSGRYWTSLL